MPLRRFDRPIANWRPNSVARTAPEQRRPASGPCLRTAPQQPVAQEQAEESTPVPVSAAEPR
ncbi:MAG TPA: hypothetical protein VG893_11225 [Terracidiphilus sp.]|nr:hypothetical protein [Terracidiphilus sp.]